MFSHLNLPSDARDNGAGAIPSESPKSIEPFQALAKLRAEVSSSVSRPRPRQLPPVKTQSLEKNVHDLLLNSVTPAHKLSALSALPSRKNEPNLSPLPFGIRDVRQSSEIADTNPPDFVPVGLHAIPTIPERNRSTASARPLRDLITMIAVPVLCVINLFLIIFILVPVFSGQVASTSGTVNLVNVVSVLSSGSVGIGNTNPSASLEIGPGTAATPVDGTLRLATRANTDSRVGAYSKIDFGTVFSPDNSDFQLGASIRVVTTQAMVSNIGNVRVIDSSAPSTQMIVDSNDIYIHGELTVQNATIFQKNASVFGTTYLNNGVVIGMNATKRWCSRVQMV